MYEALLKATPEYQKIAASFAQPGPAALFGLPPAGRALLYAALQKDLGRVLCIVTPGEAEATTLRTTSRRWAFLPPCSRPGTLCCAQWRARAASTSTAAFRCWAPLQAGG